MVFIVLFWLIWIEQNRKNKYIALQRELMQKRSDTFLTAGDEAENEQNLDKLRKEKLSLCVSCLLYTSPSPRDTR